MIVTDSEAWRLWKDGKEKKADSSRKCNTQCVE